MKNFTSVSFQQVLSHVDHRDVMGLENRLRDIKHRRFEIEKHAQGNI
jgi:hypothetical protein